MMDMLKLVLDNPNGPYEWLHILQAFATIITLPEFTNDQIEILRRGRDFRGKIILSHCYDGPHSKSPDEFINLFCIDMLNKFNIV